MTEADYDLVMDVNLKGDLSWHPPCCQTDGETEIRKNHQYFFCGRHYRKWRTSELCRFKAGIIGLTKSAAKETGQPGDYGKHGSTGIIETEMTAVLPEEQKSKLASQIPLGRFGQPEDVAAAIVFLASEYGAYITGQVLQVDGGMVM